MVIEKVKMKVKLLLSRIQLFVTLWTVAYHAPPSKGFSRQEYWMGCHFLLHMVLENSLISFSFFDIFYIFTFHSFIVLQFFWHHLLKRLFSPLNILACFICQRLIYRRCMFVCFLGDSLFCSNDLCVYFCAKTTLFNDCISVI